METIVGEFPNLYPKSIATAPVEGQEDNDRGRKDGDGNGSDGTEGTENEVAGNGTRVWFQMMDEVIRYTLLDIHQMYSMPVREFLTYYSYCAWKIQKKNDEIKKMERAMRRKNR